MTVPTDHLRLQINDNTFETDNKEHPQLFLCMFLYLVMISGS